jgi:hypothetical protein
MLRTQQSQNQEVKQLSLFEAIDLLSSFDASLGSKEGVSAPHYRLVQNHAKEPTKLCIGCGVELVVGENIELNRYEDKHDYLCHSCRSFEGQVRLTVSNVLPEGISKEHKNKAMLAQMTLDLLSPELVAIEDVQHSKYAASIK